MAVYEFGPFRFDEQQRELLRGQTPIPLQPKTLDLLAVLLSRRGQIVEKAELMKLVWPDAVVEETGLARNVSLLRKALGDETEEYIETAPKRGYRFREAPPSGAPPAPAPKRSWRKAASLAAGIVLLCLLVWWQFYRPSRYLPPAALAIAVTPFEVLTGDLERSEFARGFADVASVELSKTAGVHVISPAVVWRYKSTGVPVTAMMRLLNLDLVVEGSAQKFGPRVRVSVRLVDVHSGKVVWGESYDRPAEALIEAQTEIARAIAGRVGTMMKQRR